MNKRGLSDVVTAVIIILLVIAAIGIIWGFVAPTLRKSGSQISTSKFTTNLEVPAQYSLQYDNNQNAPGQDIVAFTIERKAGTGNIAGLVVVFEDATHQTVKIDSTVSPSAFGGPVTLNELDKKTFTLIVPAPNPFTLLNPITKISVAPIFANSDGTTSIGNTVERNTPTSSSGSVTPSCGGSSQQCCTTGTACNSGTCSNGFCPIGGGGQLPTVSIVEPQQNHQYYIPYVSVGSGSSITYRKGLLDLTIGGSPNICTYDYGTNTNLPIPGCVDGSFEFRNEGSNIPFMVKVVNSQSQQATASTAFSVKTCPGDMTGDGIVDFNDQNAYFSFVGRTNCIFGSDCYGADINGDGNVDAVDFNVVLSYYGQSCVTLPASCGNGVIDTGEQCDGSASFSTICSAISNTPAFTSGVLRCGNNCQFITTAYSPTTPDTTGRCFTTGSSFVSLTPPSKGFTSGQTPVQNPNKIKLATATQGNLPSETLTISATPTSGVSEVYITNEGLSTKLATSTTSTTLTYNPSADSIDSSGVDSIKSYDIYVVRGANAEHFDKIKYLLVSPPVISTFGGSFCLPRAPDYHSIRIQEPNMGGNARAWYTIGNSATEHTLTPLSSTPCPAGSGANCVIYSIPASDLTTGNFPAPTSTPCTSTAPATHQIVTIHINAVDENGGIAKVVDKQISFA